MNPVIFWKIRDEFGCFSNFSKHAINYKGKVWPNTEAAYQAEKFRSHRLDLVEAIWQVSSSPKAAADIGRDPNNPLRVDWEDIIIADPSLLKGEVDDGRGFGLTPVVEAVKDICMYDIIFQKAIQNEDVKYKLLSTLGAPIIEDSKSDEYWGWGNSKQGVNRLGKIWMGVRDKMIVENHNPTLNVVTFLVYGEDLANVMTSDYVFTDAGGMINIFSNDNKDIVGCRMDAADKVNINELEKLKDKMPAWLIFCLRKWLLTPMT